MKVNDYDIIFLIAIQAYIFFIRIDIFIFIFIIFKM